MAGQAKALHTFLGTFGNAKTVSNPNARRNTVVTLNFISTTVVAPNLQGPLLCPRQVQTRLFRSRADLPHLLPLLGRRRLTGT